MGRSSWSPTTPGHGGSSVPVERTARGPLMSWWPLETKNLWSSVLLAATSTCGDQGKHDWKPRKGATAHPHPPPPTSGQLSPSPHILTRALSHCFDAGVASRTSPACCSARPARTSLTWATPSNRKPRGCGARCRTAGTTSSWLWTVRASTFLPSGRRRPAAGFVARRGVPVLTACQGD